MPAFDKIRSGVEGIDKTLDSIRLGDNVVWQVSDIEEYLFFVEQFARLAIKEKRNLIYMRFAHHKPLLKQQEGLKIIELDADAGFEAFTVRVQEIIKLEGQEAFYIFDSISELQAAWSADLMMGNFFVVTCPLLFELNTVAYFGIIRGRHSFDTIARIRETTQILVDVYSDNDEIYIHPLKVWKRYSNSMFLPHRFEKNNSNSFTALTGGLSVSKFYALVEKKASVLDDQNLDSWDRFFLFAKMNLGKAGQDTANDMCERLMGREKKLTDLLTANFKIKDLIAIKERMIGSGKIGGKATGMLLSRKIVENIIHRISARLEPHDSFYIGSDVYYTYIVQNDCWKLRLAQKSEADYFSAGKKLKQKILNGIFPDTTREQFKRMLEYYGQSPIVVRSSSLQEDSFENAFAGKYESVFCVNSGSLEERLNNFEKAVKQVYASTMNESALEYRLQRGLSKSDEQMAVLVQRVSGLRFDSVFMPCAAGVGYSYNSYRWHKDIDPVAGMVRLVMGLGTRAVERTGGDYPRIASLNKPQLTPLTSSNSKSRYSQHRIDFLDLEKNIFSSANLAELAQKLPDWYRKIMFEHDYETERLLREQGKYEQIIFSTCEGLIKMEDFIGTLKQLMSVIQKEYNYPVDIEFTCNFTEQGDFLINLLQCRPLQVGGIGAKVTIPDIENGKIFFELSGGTMGGAVSQSIDIVIQVDPAGYYRLPYKKKHTVARIIGRINQYFKDKEKAMMLLAPGRIGTTSPELGITISFAEISNFKVICEIYYKDAGYMPELSFGTHFFNDLVETGIFYASILEDDNTIKFKPDFLEDKKSILPDLWTGEKTDSSEFMNIIKVYDVSNMGLILFSDMISSKTVCGIFKK
ncbi:MAG: PEP/pyruvate-binding domain-containing protein [Actinobacteria bacterium]|nr:PEP/pyruvate-binding domain-containing protein [Actinomycetota bacterium]